LIKFRLLTACNVLNRNDPLQAHPEDFVKEQRTYFADVGAFELPEEEVSDSELERELKLIPEYMTFLSFSCIEVV
jgi:hypothetical protein